MTYDSKCKVLFIVNSLAMGGAEKHIVTLINYLDGRYFELHLCYLKDIISLLPQIKKDKLKGSFLADVKSKIDFKSGQLVANYVDVNNIDLIMSTDMYPMLYAGLAKILSKRNPLLVEALHSAQVENFHDKLELLFYRPFFCAQNRLVYVSKNQRDYWRQKGVCADNDCVIYNGIDPEYFKDIYTAQEKLAIRQSYGFNNEDYLIGICAVLRPEKAHCDLLQAIKNLQLSGVVAKCLIIGDGEERINIEQQIVDLGLHNNVMITGYQQDVRPYIAACDVMAIVSHFESFSIALLEAMSMDKPVIRSDVCGGDELVTDGVNGYLFPTGNIQALEAVLLKLNNIHTRETFGKQAREIVITQFSVDEMIAKFHKLFLDLWTQN